MPDHEVSLTQSWVITVRSKLTFVVFAEEDNRDKGKLYKPQSKLEERALSSEKTPSSSNNSKKESNAALAKKKAGEKKKSNLEMFATELRQ